MNLFLCKAVTPGQRHHKKIQKNLLCKKNRLLKNLMYNIKRCVWLTVEEVDGLVTLYKSGTLGEQLQRALRGSASRQTSGARA